MKVSNMLVFFPFSSDTSVPNISLHICLENVKQLLNQIDLIMAQRGPYKKYLLDVEAEMPATTKRRRLQVNNSCREALGYIDIHGNHQLLKYNVYESIKMFCG